ncbi:MAG: hypothetical protein AVDCRST_MAG22-2869, partial [uncultured Rubrobacteraceae bacterium]
ARDEKAGHEAVAGGCAQGVRDSDVVGRVRNVCAPGGGPVFAGGRLDTGPL